MSKLAIFIEAQSYKNKPVSLIFQRGRIAYLEDEYFEACGQNVRELTKDETAIVNASKQSHSDMLKPEWLDDAPVVEESAPVKEESAPDKSGIGDMNKRELLEFASDNGIDDVDPTMTKPQILKAIKGA